MSNRPTVPELASMVERLLRELERHDGDYHYITKPGLVQEAKGLLWRVWAREGETRGEPVSETEGEEGKGKS